MRKILFAAAIAALTFVLIGCLPRVDAGFPEVLELAVQSETETVVVFREASTVYDLVLYVGGASDVVSSSPAFHCEAFGPGYTCEAVDARAQLQPPVSLTFLAEADDPLNVTAQVWYSVVGWPDRISRQTF